MKTVYVNLAEIPNVTEFIIDGVLYINLAAAGQEAAARIVSEQTLPVRSA